MYTRRIDDRRGNFNPPENYSGNAFNQENQTRGRIDNNNNNDNINNNLNSDIDQPNDIAVPKPEPVPPPQPAPEQFNTPPHEPFNEPSSETFAPQHSYPPPPPHRGERRDGFLDGIFSRLKNIELDDLLLIGLIILLSSNRNDSECGDNDDLLLILGLLFVMGL
ncbi:MAG: hypothetical protein HFE63_07545 [Clostridiales bacterium]|nr:hypothetical protein [Clostridiales bacterium]